MSGEVINSALPVERLQSGETAKKILGPASDERSPSGSGGMQTTISPLRDGFRLFTCGEA